jgi:hypothetical protein
MRDTHDVFHFSVVRLYIGASERPAHRGYSGRWAKDVRSIGKELTAPARRGPTEYAKPALCSSVVMSSFHLDVVHFLTSGFQRATTSLYKMHVNSAAGQMPCEYKTRDASSDCIGFGSSGSAKSVVECTRDLHRDKNLRLMGGPVRLPIDNLYGNVGPVDEQNHERKDSVSRMPRHCHDRPALSTLRSANAHHSREFSNTQQLYRLGWRGINIGTAPASPSEFDVCALACDPAMNLVAASASV